MKLGYLAIDQHSNHVNIKKNPRKELLEWSNRRHADIMYQDTSTGPKQIGYVIGEHWFKVFEIHEWSK